MTIDLEMANNSSARFGKLCVSISPAAPSFVIPSVSVFLPRKPKNLQLTCLPTLTGVFRSKEMRRKSLVSVFDGDIQGAEGFGLEFAVFEDGEKIATATLPK